MHQIDPFSVNSPTEVQFGLGSSKALPKLLPSSKAPIVLVQGASGVQSAAFVRELRRQGRQVYIVRQKGEPSIDTVNSALGKLLGRKISAVVACGGGSVIDAGKILAFLLEHKKRLPTDFSKIDPADLEYRRDIRSIAIPTTAGTGAEVTANAVLSVPSLAAKVSIRGKALFPDIALVDPVLMKTAPIQVTINSGLDAVTQVIESYTSLAATPFSDALSLPAISTGLRSLQNIVDHDDQEAWSEMAWVSLSSGLALANSGLGAAHGLASVLGGQYVAPHGALCGRLVVPVLRSNLRNAANGSIANKRLITCVTAIAQVFAPIEGGDFVSGLDRWIDRNNVPRLRDWGVQDSDIESVAAQSIGASSSKKNAVPLKPQDLERVLQEAL